MTRQRDNNRQRPLNFGGSGPVQNVIVLELNEINFEFLDFYIKQGRLPHLAAFFGRHGYCETTSEQEPEHLEPWIQWVTAHTGQSFAEHGIKRLGDIVGQSHPQIWERLEAEKGLRTGAVSPMNATNSARAPAFFLPDPWTRTGITGSPLAKLLYGAVAQAVNDNAQARITPWSAVKLILGWLRYSKIANWPQYVGYALAAREKPWSKALFLDLLLTDLFFSKWRRTKPDFSTLFLNAGAHIQHHYMFSSAAYAGSNRNPDWYIKPGVDPLLEVYELYDRILGRALGLSPEPRIMLATGLHQDPHPTVTYYYRLKNHEAFLRRIGIPFASVVPRMSRDFHLHCTDAAEALEAEARLRAVRAETGEPLFYVDNRGHDLFVMLTYPNEIGPGFRLRVGNEEVEGFDQDVAFVALKNGEHNGIGYFADSGQAATELPASFPLKDLPNRIVTAFP